MDDIVREFLVESHEGLDQLDQDFVELEQNPQDKALLDNIFRCIHTIKGTCGFLGFSKLESVTHVGENLLSRLRDGVVEITPDRTSALLSLVDAVRSIMGNIEQAGDEGDTDYSELIASLSKLQETTQEASQTESAASIPTPSDDKSSTTLASSEPTDHVPEATQHTAPTTISQPPSAVQTNRVSPAPKATPPSQGPAAEPQGLQPKRPAKDSGGAISESSIRVDVGLLDKLMNLVGELVLARNQVLQYTSQNQDPMLNATSQRLNLITTELQEGVMKTRMQPIGNVWSKFPRIVRDLGVVCGKAVTIEMEGKGTELDKTIIEAIKDPLTHIVRNAVDHGIESSDERETAGKPKEGVLRLRAYHESGQVIMEISDDGKGIDPKRLLDKALSRSLITQEQVARMSERDVLNLIFLPGFSTSEQVTNVSGRGVGMDVVRSNIEKIGGTVDIQSRVGHGTTLKIKIPLTLAIIPALVVTCRRERFALPQVNLLELVRLEGRQARRGIEHVHGVPVYRLRGRLLPLVHLSETLGHPPRKKEEDDVVNIVVLQADERHFGLIVDEINDTEEIVVKPLGKQLKNISAFAGATIMGDGTVALILDVLGLAQRSQVVSESRARHGADAIQRTTNSETEQQTMLLFTVGSNRRIAIPLSMVSRLEEFPLRNVEFAGDMEVVQYRGNILPLVHLSELLGHPSQQKSEESLQVVVYSNGNSSVGLVVDRILDIVREAFVIQKCQNRKGVFGSAVIQDRVTDLLDVQAAIDLSTICLFKQTTDAVSERA
ncbi:MAG: chemotaxis protein CheA [Myxococcales bacterium]|nr:chemotaxis protein CheA [Myxococcales bacterium]